MLKKMITLTIIVLLTITFLQNCDTTEPLVDNLKPGRRDYKWTIDTINAPYDTYYRIWGSSPTDIWLTSTGDWDKSIAHYDGDVWSLFGVVGMNVPHSVFGFSNSEVYVGSAGGGIWKYDGTSWDLFAEITKDNRNDIVFDNIWGKSSNDFFAFGAYIDENYLANNSVVVHFSNNEWNIFNMEGVNGIVENLFQSETDTKIYLKTLEWNNGETYDSIFVYEYYNKKYKKLYSSTWDFDQAANISLINGEIYFVLGRNVAKRINDEFITILNIDNLNFYNAIWGKSSKDIFLKMTDGLAHYNGNNIEYLLHFEKQRTQIFGAALFFEKDVFFLVYESSTNLNLIYHGKLE